MSHATPAGPPPPPPPPGGQPTQYSMQPQPKQANVAAILSLIVGILSCIPFAGFVATILGIVGIKKSSNPMVGGRGLAIAGLVLGLIGVVWSIIFMVTGAGVLALFKATGPARDQAKAFISDLDKGDVATAMTRVTGDISADELKLVSDRMKTWGGVKNVTMVGMNVSAQTGSQTTTIVTGAVEFGNLNKSFTATLVKEGETYKIREFKFD
jgi:hypothetical protein